MSSTSPSSPTKFTQAFMGSFHSRKLMINNSLNQQPDTPAPAPCTVETSMDSNVVIVLSFLVCAVICSIGLNFLIRCVLNSYSSRLVYSESRANTPTPTGISKMVLKTFPVVHYSAELKLPDLDTECVICLLEFVAGERVRLLPKSNHGFHDRCIDKWLRSHSSCPKCTHCLIETCEKIVGCNQQASS